MDHEDNCEGECVHQKLFQALIEATKPIDMPSIERTFIVAQFLGSVVAFQDDRSLSKDDVYQTMMEGIMVGNASAAENLRQQSATIQ